MKNFKNYPKEEFDRFAIELKRICNDDSSKEKKKYLFLVYIYLNLKIILNEFFFSFVFF